MLWCIQGPLRPFSSLQVVVGLLQLSDVFVELLLDAACLAQVVLQHGDLLVALSVLMLQLLLQDQHTADIIDHVFNL